LRLKDEVFVEASHPLFYVGLKGVGQVHNIERVEKTQDDMQDFKEALKEFWVAFVLIDRLID